MLMARRALAFSSDRLGENPGRQGQAATSSFRCRNVSRWGHGIKFQALRDVPDAWQSHAVEGSVNNNLSDQALGLWYVQEIRKHGMLAEGLKAYLRHNRQSPRISDVASPVAFRQGGRPGRVSGQSADAAGRYTKKRRSSERLFVQCHAARAVAQPNVGMCRL